MQISFNGIKNVIRLLINPYNARECSTKMNAILGKIMAKHFDVKL